MFSFFDDKPGQEQAKPLISRVKKMVPKPRGPVLSTPQKSGGFSGTHNPSSSSKSGSTSSASLKPPKPAMTRPGSSSSITKAKTTPRSSPAPTPRKRKVESRVQSESDSSSEDDAFDVKTKKRAISRGTTAGAGGEDGVDEVKWGDWDLGLVDMRGEWGRGWCGFVGSDEVIRGGLKGWAGGGKMEGTLDKYVPCESAMTAWTRFGWMDADRNQEGGPRRADLRLPAGGFRQGVLAERGATIPSHGLPRDVSALVLI